MKKFLDWNTLMKAKKILKSLILPILVFVMFSVMTKGRFCSIRMLETTLRQSIVPALITYSLVLTLTLQMYNFASGAVILSASIIGGNLALMLDAGLFGMLIIVAVAFIIGAVIGFLYIKMRVPCMVLTIGLMLVFEALPRVIFGAGVNLSGVYSIPALSPWCFIIFGVMLVVFYVIFNMTALGHNLQAVGANQSIADSVGVNSDKVKFMSFLIGGLFLGAAAVIYAATSGQIRPVSALGSLAIVMDGFMGMFLALFISRYCNLAFAVPISAVTMKLISNGFVSLGVSATVRDITNGILLLILLTISMNQGFFENRKADAQFAREAKAALLAK